MKKFLALALASVMAVSLVACGSTNNAATDAESSAAATTTAAATESGSEEPWPEDRYRIQPLRRG